MFRRVVQGTILGVLAVFALGVGACGDDGAAGDPSGSDPETFGADAAGDDAGEASVEALDTTRVTKAAPTKLVALIWDGSSATGSIKDAFLTAIDGVSGWSHIKWYYIGGTSSLSTAKSKIESGVSSYGLPKSSLSVLVIGKSLGGAKTYKFANDQAGLLDDFYRSAVVTVDAHEPGAPGDEGRCNYWYDYVRFRCDSSGWNDHYDLAWRSVWNDRANAGRLEFFNVYQRNEWPRGYRFSDALGMNTRATSGDHWSIANSTYSRSAIQAAISFLVR